LSLKFGRVRVENDGGEGLFGVRARDAFTRLDVVHAHVLIQSRARDVRAVRVHGNLTNTSRVSPELSSRFSRAKIDNFKRSTRVGDVLATLVMTVLPTSKSNTARLASRVS
jgi:hypothetical protein